MASIKTPRDKLSRGTKSNPVVIGEGNYVEVNAMSLRSGKRKITCNLEDVNTPQKENVAKRRKSNRVDVLKGATPTNLGSIKTDENLATSIRKTVRNGSNSTLNNSVISLSPKLKDITKSVQNKLTKDVTPKPLEARKTNEKLSTPSQQNLKKKNDSSITNRSLRFQNDSVLVLTPKAKGIRPITNTLTKDFTPKHLETSTTNKNSTSSRRKSMKDSALLTPVVDFTPKHLETSTTNKNSTSSRRKSMKDSNTNVIKKSLGMQNDSVIAVTPNPNVVTRAVAVIRGKKKNVVHPGDFTEIGQANTSLATQHGTDNSCATESCNESIIILSPEMPESNNSKTNILNNREAKESEIEMKEFLKHGTIIDSDSFTAPGHSRSHMNNSLDSFVLEPLPEDVSQLLETSSDPEISMTLNTTYDLEENVTQNVTSNALSTRKSVHFKQTPEILGPRRRSNSFPNVSLESVSNCTTENIKQRISTPAVRRRAGSTPVPTRKNGSSATKLPDFSLIHQRNFEKMESIYDFHHRRKGSSQKKVPPVVQESKLPRSTSVVVFKATASSTPLPTTSKIPVAFKPNSRSTPAKPSYSEAKEAIMRKTPVKKTPTQSASVENNRNILKGVRLNRRFELQMKHRNMK